MDALVLGIRRIVLDGLDGPRVEALGFVGRDNTRVASPAEAKAFAPTAVQSAVDAYREVVPGILLEPIRIGVAS